MNRTMALLLSLLLCCTFTTIAPQAETSEESEKSLQLFLEGQKELSLDRYAQAREAFQKAYQQSTDSALAGNSLYWQAFSEYRLGRVEELQAAQELLTKLLREYPKSGSADDALQLYTQVRARLAALGDAAAASQMAVQAAQLGKRAQELAMVGEELAAQDGELDRQEQHELQEIQEQLKETQYLLQETNERAVAVRVESQEAYRRMHALLAAEHPEILLLPDAERIPLLEHIAPPPPPKEVDELRLAALNSLLRMDPDRAMEILRTLLSQRDEDNAPLRVKAAMILAMHEAGDAPDLLIDVIRHDPSPEVRLRALQGVWRYDRPEINDLLMEILLHEPREELKEVACIGIINDKEPARVRPQLKQIASTKELPQRIREHAVEALARDGDKEAVTFLRDLYDKTSDRDLRLVIAICIGQREDPETMRWLMEKVRDRNTDLEIREKAFYWVGRDKHLATEDLVELYLSFPPGQIRKQAVHVIGSREDDQALDFLIEVARQDEDPEARLAAVHWIGRYPNEKAVAFIKELLSEE